MKQRGGPLLKWVFVSAFLALTFFTWCPVGYGSYGPVDRVFGIPSWAAIALALAAVLFVLEWIFLFFTGVAITDEEVSRAVAKLESTEANESAPAGKDK